MYRSRDFCEEEQAQGTMLLPQLLFLPELYYPGSNGLACGKVMPGMQGWIGSVFTLLPGQ